MRPLALLVGKDLRLLFRDPLGVVVTFALPLLFAVLFGFVFSEAQLGQHTMAVALVEAGPEPQALALGRSLAASPTVRATTMSKAAAEAALRRGELDVYLELGAPAHPLRVVHTPGNELSASLLKGALLSALSAQSTQAGPRIDVLALRPARAGQARTGSPFDASLALGMVWAIVCCAAIFGVSLVVERQRKTLERLCTLPLATWQLLAGKALACALTIMLVAGALVAVAVLAFGVRPGSPVLLAVAIVCSGLGFGGMTLALAALSPTERSATGLAWGVLTLLAMVGGGTVPLSQLPAWLRSLSSFSPFHWAVLAVEGAVWRGFTPAEMALPCTALLAAGAACFALGTRAFRSV